MNLNLNQPEYLTLLAMENLNYKRQKKNQLVIKGQFFQFEKLRKMKNFQKTIYQHLDLWSEFQQINILIF